MNNVSPSYALQLIDQQNQFEHKMSHFIGWRGLKQKILQLIWRYNWMMIFNVKILFLSTCVLLILPHEYSSLENDELNLWEGGNKRSAISK